MLIHEVPLHAVKVAMSVTRFIGPILSCNHKFSLTYHTHSDTIFEDLFNYKRPYALF